MPKKPETIRTVKGMRDLLPPELYLWKQVEDDVHRVFGAYNFGEIRTPILEQTSLFARTVGVDTDIVSKEMFTFDDRESESLDSLDDPKVLKVFNALSEPRWEYRTVPGIASSSGLPDPEVREILHKHRVLFRKSGLPDREGNDLFTLRAASVSLRPEATASVVRAYVEHSLYNEGRIHKLYYMGPMFRRERPQKGRYRQFYQIGAEVLGSDSPLVDAEVLEMLVVFLQRAGGVGVGEFKLLINTVGCTKCRPEYLKALRRALESVEASMCADCQRRAKTNPLRVFDCKVEADQPIIAKLPTIFDHLDAECQQHFDRVTAELRARGIAHEVTPRLVRGLDYYTRTTFEITSRSLGAQDAILGGGRYDGLSEMLGGPPAPGIGFAIGQDRLIQAISEYAKIFTAKQPEWMDQPLHVYVIWLGPEAREAALNLARELRGKDLKVAIEYEPVKLKKSLAAANKLGARFAVIIGEGELASGHYQVKEMGSGLQEEVERGQVLAYLQKKLEAASALPSASRGESL